MSKSENLLAGYKFASLPVCTWILYSVESKAPDACGHSCYKTQVFKCPKIGVFGFIEALDLSGLRSLCVSCDGFAVSFNAVLVIVFIVMSVRNFAKIDR